MSMKSSDVIRDRVAGKRGVAIAAGVISPAVMLS
jgi:hypothetical protein